MSLIIVRDCIKLNTCVDHHTHKTGPAQTGPAQTGPAQTGPAFVRVLVQYNVMYVDVNSSLNCLLFVGLLFVCLLLFPDILVHLSICDVLCCFCIAPVSSCW